MIRGDLRAALRGMRNRPGVSALIVLTLAIGLGASTTVYSVISALLLRPLPYPAVERLVFVVESGREAVLERIPLSPPDFADLARETRTLEDVAGVIREPVVLGGTLHPERVTAGVVTPTFLPLLGARAVIGRLPVAEDARPNAGRVVVLSHALWQRRYGASRHLVGRSIDVDGVSCRVIGVLAPGFQIPGRLSFQGASFGEPEAFVPLHLEDWQIEDGRFDHRMAVVGRLAPGVTHEAAQADVARVASSLAARFPKTNGDLGALVLPLREAVVGGVRSALWVLLGAVVCVLLVACSNAAGLLLARAASRHRELAVRAALGATRLALVRLFVVEGITHAMLAAALGLTLAAWGIDGLVSLALGNVLRARAVGLDPGVVGFAVALALVSGAATGLVPAIALSKGDLHVALQSAGPEKGATARTSTLRGLVTAQVTLAVVLLVGAGILLRTFIRLSTMEPGFDAQGVLAAAPSLPEGRYPDAPSVADFWRRLLERAATLPGVTAASAVSQVPPRAGWVVVVAPEGAPPGELAAVNHFVAAPGYFEALRLPIQQGRSFDARDHAGAPGVCVVDGRFAERFWPGVSPIGKRVKWGPSDGNRPWMTVVGVASEVRTHHTDRVSADGTLYVPFLQLPSDGVAPIGRLLSILVRADRPRDAERRLRRALAELDPAVPLANVITLDEALAESLAEPRLRSHLVLGFAVIAAGLAALGIYGVLAFSIAQRRRELGIRLALGAERRDLLRMVLREGLRVATPGLALGAGIWLVLMIVLGRVRPLSGFALGDVPAILAAVACLALCALVASLGPARRAARTEPADVLRGE